jgi:hypothetical protein
MWSLLLSAALAAPAAAGSPVIVWLEPTAPDAKAVQKVENDVGPGTQLYHLDLAFPPEPASEADVAAYKKLRDGVTVARERWDDFEVELGLARQLEEQINAITVIRDERDSDALIDALCMQGAAIDRAFEDLDFQEGAQAEPFRVKFEGQKKFLIEPWVLALAIDSDHKLGMDVAEQATFPDLQRLQDAVNDLDSGTLDLSSVPAGATLVLDGTPQAVGSTLTLRPGTHYLHFMRDGVVSGRNRVAIQPGETAKLPVLVDAEELATARTKLLDGTTTGFPEDVKKALTALAAYYKGPVFVAASDDGKIEIQPYAQGAALLKQQLVTFTFTGDIGPELIITPLFDEAEGANITGIGASASLGGEIGVSYGAVAGGMDLAFTPGRTVSFANGDKTANIHTSALPQPWGGIGVYGLRPIGTSPYLFLVGTYSWLGPAHYAPGARLTLGIPFETPKQWLRVTIGGSAAKKQAANWDAHFGGTDVPMYTMFLRVGIGSGF